MPHELNRAEVAARLALLRRLYVPETEAEARRKMEPPHAEGSSLTSEAVAHRLRELRALMALTTHLHRARAGKPAP